MNQLASSTPITTSSSNAVNVANCLINNRNTTKPATKWPPEQFTAVHFPPKQEYAFGHRHNITTNSSPSNSVAAQTVTTSSTTGSTSSSSNSNKSSSFSPNNSVTPSPTPLTPTKLLTLSSPNPTAPTVAAAATPATAHGNSALNSPAAFQQMYLRHSSTSSVDDLEAMEPEQLLTWCKKISSQAIGIAIKETQTGDHQRAIGAVNAAIDLMRQSCACEQPRCQRLIISLEDMMRRLEVKLPRMSMQEQKHHRKYPSH